MYQVEGRSPKGKRLFTFKPGTRSRIIDSTQVGCGRCDGCHFDRVRQWFIRCEAESLLSSSNSFVTLTYSPEFLPANGSLVFKHLQDFFKRLRKSGAKFRYFACGEYGEKLSRPHYHICFFGYDFPDRELFTTRRGRRVYKSKLLESKWTFGLSEVMDFSPGASAYVAGYCFKKVNGLLKFFWSTKLVPEFVCMSRMKSEGSLFGGIGGGFFTKFFSDMFPNDKFVSENGSVSRPPRYFMKALEKSFLSMFSSLKSLRIADPVTGEIRPEVSQAELDVRAELFRAKFKRQRRFLEDL